MADAEQGAAADIEMEVLPSRDDKYRVAIKGQDTGAWFTWRRVYAFNPDFHDDGYDPYAAAVADLEKAELEYPGREMRVEVLRDNGDETFTATTNPDGSEARMSNNDGTHSWVPVQEG